MHKLNFTQAKQNTLDQGFHLTTIKRDCYDMLVRSRRGEDQGYDKVVDGLNDLNFVEHTLEEYKTKLVGLIDRMIQLDDMSFDSNKLYQFRNGLRQ